MERKSSPVSNQPPSVSFPIISLQSQFNANQMRHCARFYEICFSDYNDRPRRQPSPINTTFSILSQPKKNMEKFYYLQNESIDSPIII